MPTDAITVDWVRFAQLENACSSLDLMKNRCKAVVFQQRLWTVTSTACRGAERALKLHELVPPEHYIGKTGSYPMSTEGQFYKGQMVRARGQPYILSGEILQISRQLEPSPEQSDLFPEPKV